MKYDAIIIGAGMSGLAAGIRLSMYDKKVIILESHSRAGGLNSYYQRGNREFDVGLHAMTNYVPKKTKGHPLNKLLKQLRIPYDHFDLSPQIKSRIHFPDHQLEFTNELGHLVSEIELKFPTEIDGFMNLIKFIETYNETNLENKQTPAKPIVAEYIKDDYLLEMIFAPLLIYGSATPNDMDFSQFVIMFKSIYMEGFARPKGGVRVVIDTLLAKFASLGGVLKYKSEVSRIVTNGGKTTGVELASGEFIEAEKIFSSAGLPETLDLVEDADHTLTEVGELSFCETILNLKTKPVASGIDDTIVFYNDSQKYHYSKSLDFYDTRSAVICLPNNYQRDDYDEGMIRLTYISNFELWNDLLQSDKEAYKEMKSQLLNDSIRTIEKVYPHYNVDGVFSDVFTPTSIKRYTGHYKGTVYGSPIKIKDGRTKVDGLYIIGTDQGFLGIVGSMLSGISMANLHGLMN